MTTATHVILLARFLSIGCFIAAAIIDWPARGGPGPEDRRLGNFCCSAGFVFLAIGAL